VHQSMFPNEDILGQMSNGFLVIEKATEFIRMIASVIFFISVYKIHSVENRYQQRNKRKSYS